MLQFYNSEQMQQFRTEFLNGSKPSECNTCYYQDDFGKLSGRKKQLLKSAIQVGDFANSFKSSPHYNNFKYSHDNNGLADHLPTDLQIDLGNLCNSACIMCEPRASSRLSQDYQKLHKINDTLFIKPERFDSWSSDPELVNQFVDELIKIPNLKYIHLLGGETLFIEAFYTICERLIDAGLSKNIIMGTTTNSTIFSERLRKIIPEFKQFHLGISIESVSKLNDYIRYPADISIVLENINKFVELRKTYPDLFITLRITPNVFTIYELDELLEFVINNHITAESCNILYKPECLRMEVMPEDIRAEAISKLKRLILKYQLVRHNVQNVRNPANIDQTTADTVFEYLEFLSTYTVPDNVDVLRTQLVTFLKSFESIRNNSILDYAPRYKDFLRHIGY